jgi:hypothetical protein
MSRQDAGVNLALIMILHKSLTIATRPNATAALEQQMAKNEAAMGSSAAAKSVLNSETTKRQRVVEVQKCRLKKSKILKIILQG